MSCRPIIIGERSVKLSFGLVEGVQAKLKHEVATEPGDLKMWVVSLLHAI